MLAGLALASVVVMLGPAPAAWADETLTVVNTDVTAYPDVRVILAVPAQVGDQGLTAPVVTVTEGGQNRPVRVEALPVEGLEVALVVDTSGSMVGSPLAAAKTAAQAFLTQLPVTVPVSVIGFGASPAVVSPRSVNRSAQVAAIRALAAGGQTALYDALRTAMAQLQAPGVGARRMVVLLTDGGDTASVATLDATAAAMAAAKVPLFAVELRTVESRPAALTTLTSASGGRVVPAADPAALAGAFDEVAKQLVRQYAVTYRSEANGASEIDIAVDAQGTRTSARLRLALPAAPAPNGATPVDDAAPVGARGPSAVGDWALLVGGGLCGLSLLGLLLGYAISRTPRARGLVAPRSGMGLAGVTDRAELVGNSVLRRGNWVAPLSRALELAGVDIRPGELLVAAAAGSVVMFGIGWLLIGPLIGLVLALMVPLLARGVLRLLATRRRQKFSDQMADTLQILAGSLRAGHGLSQGIDTVAREAESPTAEEFRRLTVETRLGRDLVEALESLADRVGSEDFQWVVQAVQIQREVGGDLAAILDTVASTVRDRTRVRRQVSALSAEGRMSAWVLMILPFGLGGMMAVTNRGYLAPLFTTGTGVRLLVVGAVLLAAGGLWLRRIVKPIF